MSSGWTYGAGTYKHQMPSDRNFTFQLKAEIQKYNAKQDLSKTLELLYFTEKEKEFLRKILDDEEAAKLLYKKLAKRILKESGIHEYVQALLDRNRCLDLIKEQRLIVEEAMGYYFELKEMFKDVYQLLVEERTRRIRAEASIQVNCEGCPAKQLLPCEQDDEE